MEAFEEIDADAVTVNPYFGYGSYEALPGTGQTRESSSSAGPRTSAPTNSRA